MPKKYSIPFSLGDYSPVPVLGSRFDFTRNSSFMNNVMRYTDPEPVSFLRLLLKQHPVVRMAGLGPPAAGETSGQD